MKHKAYVVLHLLFLGLVGANIVSAQTDAYPVRPITMIVPTAPGGTTDISARMLATPLGSALGQTIVVENKGGGNGNIAAAQVKRAPADGYTLLMGHIGTLAVNPSLYPNLPYNPIKDFVPVAWVARVPNVMVVNKTVPVRNLKELVALAKSKPGSLNYSTGGNGSAAHLATEYFKMQAGVAMVHIPYRGAAPAVADVIGGSVQLIFTGAPALIGHIRSGQLTALAVSSPKRLDILPDVPTVAEALGLRGFEADQWYGLVAPAGTPRDIVMKLNRAVNEALGSEALKVRLNTEGAIATPTTPEEFGKLIASDIERWRPVITSGRVRVD
ncbi:MAG: hypothetical protein RLZZ452_1462 [Pseudomonadota bacterium]